MSSQSSRLSSSTHKAIIITIIIKLNQVKIIKLFSQTLNIYMKIYIKYNSYSININHDFWIEFDNWLKYDNFLDMIKEYKDMNIILSCNDIYIIWEIEYL